MQETIEQKSHRDEVSKIHDVAFMGGVLQCSCGWKSNAVFGSLASVERATRDHLDSIEIEE